MQVRCVHLQQAIGGIAHENAYQAQQQGGREAGVDSAQSDLAETGQKLEWEIGVLGFRVSGLN